MIICIGDVNVHECTACVCLFVELIVCMCHVLH